MSELLQTYQAIDCIHAEFVGEDYEFIALLNKVFGELITSQYLEWVARKEERMVDTEYEI